MAKKESRNSLQQCANILLPLLFMMGNGNIIQGPQNTAVDEGQTVTLICRTHADDRARWSFIHANSEKEIFNGVRVIYMNSVFKVNDSRPGQFDLQFTASTKEVATQFTCVESFTGNSKSAEVTVLESPTCSGNATCSVKFTGNWVPQLYRIPNSTVANSIVSENSGGRLLTETLVVSEVGRPPVCRIHFVRDNYNGSATATNIPDYNKTVDCTLNEGLLSTIGVSDLPSGTTNHPPPSGCGSGCVAAIVVCGLIACVCVVVVVLVVLRRKSKRGRGKELYYSQ